MARSLMSALLGGLSGAGSNRSAAVDAAPGGGCAATRKMAWVAERSNGRMIAISTKDPDNITIRRYGAPVPTDAPEPKKTDLVSRKIEAAMRATIERLMEGLDKGVSLVMVAPQAGENDMAQAATFAGFEPLMADLMFQPANDPKAQTIFAYCSSAAEEAAARASGVQMFGETKPKAAFVAAWRDAETGDICMMEAPVNVMKGLKSEVEAALPNRTQISWSSRPQISLLQAHEMSGSRRLDVVPTHVASDVAQALPVLGKDGNVALKGDPSQPDFEGLAMLRQAMNRSKRHKLSGSPEENRFLSPATVTP